MKKTSFQKQATIVSLVSIIGNIILSAVKFAAGIFSHSGAMISDAVHSSSDVCSSIIVIIGVRLSAEESDHEHPYGHERLECVAAIILATILAVTGLGIGYSAISSIFSHSYIENPTPGIFALIAALLSIISKEAMYHYTAYYAKYYGSNALMADAWHHRSDALSSIGALIGIAASRFGYAIMEPVASIIICLFICKAAFDIFKDATDKMIDKSCDEEMENDIRKLVSEQAGVISIDLLQTRLFGNKIYVDLEISANGNQSLKETHAIAENIHNLLEETYPQIKHIMIHVNPDNENS